MAVSRRLRYEILRRDGHACRYCGARAPAAILTVDHVVPVALGGTDEPSNLVTACDACNGGKTSSSPDAAIVADVSADALRWSRALSAAAGRMREKLAGQDEIHEEFDRCWLRWTCGPEKVPVPRPADWRTSVDNFLSAGLPLDILLWCAEKAMRSKAPPEHTWRYMCGVAWNRVRELQEDARMLAAGRDPWDDWEEELPPQVIQGRADLACELLGNLSNENRDRLLARVREVLEPDNDDELHIMAAHAAWRLQMTSYDRLLHSICDLLPMIPDPVMQDAVRQARADLYDKQGADFTREDWASHAMDLAAIQYAGDEGEVPF